MDFTFSEEQDQLRASVRSVLADAAADGAVRAVVDGTAPGADALRTTMADLGWLGLLAPEDCGGLDLGLVDAVVVLEEMGRVTFPGSFLSSAVVAVLAARALGELALVEALSGGGQRGTVALEELGHGDPVDRVRAFAARKGSRWLLHGTKPIVLDGPDADWVIVAARTPEGLQSFLVERPAVEPVPTLDPTRSAGRLALDATPARAVGPGGDHTALWRAVADAAAVGLAAELVGVCEASLAMAVGYAQGRVQFDVPIASHQVIQHKFVDMLHRLELGRVGVHHAAWAFDVDDPGRAAGAAVAKATMGEAAVAVTTENIQVHGAVGFTWASDAHLLYKRAKQNDLLYGGRAWHRQRIADVYLEV